ncbi:MAG: PD-(D/E)XK nuclease-like domain-containing protein [Tenacibaculum sp.]|nr:PD-(D/E)XK nuclease-like domain-containing protein [Tenacibaculum sp.]
MGQSKEMFIQMREQEIHEKMEQQEQSKVTDLINRLRAKEEVLSYSSIKNLTSPVNFMNYKLQDFKPKTESQLLGTACDLLLLTPEKFDNELVVIEKTPSAGNQENFANSLIEKVKTQNIIIDDNFIGSQVFIDTFNENYKRGKVESVENLIPYIKAKVSGKDCISKILKEEAEEITENLKKKEDFMTALENTTERQKRIDFEFLGWKFKCFLDTYSNGFFQDLKFASDCTPEKFEYDIRKFNYDVQFGLYSLAVQSIDGGIPEFEFLVFDRKGNYSILPVDYAYLKYGQKKVEFLVKCLDKMIKDNAFFNSYNFFNPRVKLCKPQWVKGFDFEIFE